VTGGVFSEQVFTTLREGALLRIEGPLGQFVYRPGERPLLLIGGGTGYAPLKAMLRQVLETETRRDVTLFWGARTQADLYEDAWLRELDRSHPRFRYTSVLSEQSATPPYESGLVHEAVVRRVAGLAGFDIYAAGPPAMIDAVRAALPVQGADPARITIDSFDYAPA
jgi:CDP-4-dehydro-6-deoxyglucose reductase